MKPYGCSNQARPVPGKTYFAAYGKIIENRMSTECKYDKSASDKRCSECKHRERK